MTPSRRSLFQAVGVGALMAANAPGVKSLYDWMAGELHSTMLLSGVAKATDLKRRNIGLAKV